MGEKSQLSISIVIPAHNEEDNIEKVVEHIIPVLKRAPIISSYELILVNDNSRDSTGDIIDRLAREDSHIHGVHRLTTPGFGNAVKTGLAAATCEVVIPVMADLSDDPEDIIHLVEKIAEGYDIAYGSRFVEGGELHGYPWQKLIANRLFNNSLRLSFGIPHRDVTNAFKAYRKIVLDEIGVDNLESSGFDLTIELAMKAHIAGFSSVEVPVRWYDRTAGEAKLKLSRNASVYGKRLLKLFVWGNLVSLRDLLKSVVKGSIYGSIFALLLGVCAIFAIFSFSGFTEVFTQIKSMSLSYAILGGLILIFSFIIRTWRWSVILRSTGHVVPTDVLFKSIMFGSLLNYLLPARLGDIARGVALKVTDNCPLGVSFSTIIVERAFDTFSLGILLTTIGLFYYQPEYLWLEIGAILLSLGLIGLLLFLYYCKSIVIRLFHSIIPNIESSIITLNVGMKEMSRNRMALLLVFGLSIIVWFSDLLCIYIAAQAIHYNISLLTVSVAGIAAFIAQSLPLTPGGIGVHEASIVGILMLFHVPPSVGISIALVDHFIRAVVVYCLGIICTIHLGFSSRMYFKTNKNSQ